MVLQLMVKLETADSPITIGFCCEHMATTGIEFQSLPEEEVVGLRSRQLVIPVKSQGYIIVSSLMMIVAVIGVVAITQNSSETGDQASVEEFGASADGLPNGVHIAFAGDDGNGNLNSMSISWNTAQETASSTVWYGTSPNVYTSSSTGKSSTYWYQAPYIHTVVLPALTPNTKYYYKCGDSVAGESQEYTFTVPGSDIESFKIAVLGDMGTAHSHASIQLLTSLQPDLDFYLHIGDVGYPDDAVLVASTFEGVWTKYWDSIQPFTSIKPYMVLPGNHEAECHDPSCVLFLQELGNFTAYNARFRMPSEESGGVLNMWYSFNYGPVHFVIVDTETDYPDAPNDDYVAPAGGFGDQAGWLEADLAAANTPEARAARPWVIVAGHRPIYSVRDSIKDADGVSTPTGNTRILQRFLEPFLNKHSVDLYLCGHVHAYERQFPVYDSAQIDPGYVNPAHTVHIISGNAGGPEGNDYEVSGVELPDWTAVFGAGYGFGTLEVVDRNTLHWTAVYSGAVRDNVAAGTVMDEVYIRKQ